MQKTGILMNCHNCQVEIYRTKARLERANKHFCSKKCSTSYNLRQRWANHKLAYEPSPCITCGLMCDGRNKLKQCKSCLNKDRIANSKSLTKGELKSKHDTRKINKWYSSEIRNFNRDWNKHLTTLSCQNCNYDKHVELSHIKSVAEFPMTATLGEINDESNNLVLCPNCHWEFDNKLLLLENIPPRKMVL